MNQGILSYVPSLLLDWYAKHPYGEIHSRSSHDGVLLFADASGFTALTRSLAAEGKIGFEILTNLLNALFRSLEQVIDCYHGEILKFSGDAVWCYFPQGTRIESVYAEMLYQIERVNREQSACRNSPLSLHAGASAGSFDMVTLGDRSGRLEFEIMGRRVVEAYYACDAATAGELAVTQELFGLLPHCEATRREQGYHILKPPFREPQQIDSINATVERTLSPVAHDLLEKYVPATVRSRKQESDSDLGLQSEHRQVAVLFASLVFPEDASDQLDQSQLEASNRLVSGVFRTIADSGGIVARIDPFSKGHKLLALFGALTKSGSDNLNALRAAETVSHTSVDGFAIRIGLAAGALLCGEVGSDRRHEYTVMGEAVNMAARLMSKAGDNTALMDDSFYESVRPFCSVIPRKLKLKGIGDDVPAYQFDAWQEMVPELPVITDFVGREHDLEQLSELWRKSLAETFQWVAITGESGVGKTTLVSAFVARYTAIRAIYLSGFAADPHQPGWLIREWLKRVYRLHIDKHNPHQDIIEAIRAKIDSRWLPLLDQILSGSITDNEWTRGLSQELRLDKLVDIVRTLLADAMNPCVVILDDLENIDSFSRTLLQKVLRDPPKTNVMAILIDAKTDWLPAEANCAVLALSGLTSEEVRLWLSGIFVPGVREKEFSNKLITSSEGNPLFIKETIKQLAAAGTLGHLTDLTKWEVLQPLAEIRLANRIEDLQLAQLDALPESQRQLLKIASVLGMRFSPQQLQQLSGATSLQQVVAGLTELVTKDLLTHDPIPNVYDFRHNLAREAIYRCIPLFDLKRSHRMVGEMLLLEGQAHNVFALAHHFSSSGEKVRAFLYSLRAATEAASQNLLMEAARFLQECDKILKSEQGKDTDPQARLEFYRQAVEFTLIEGNHADVYRWVHDWRVLARSQSLWNQYHAASNQLARILWMQAKYHRCRQVASRLTAVDATRADPALLADSFSLLGELFRRTGKLTEAQTAGHRAVELARKATDLQQEAHATNNLGLAYWSAGKLNTAREYFQSSMKLREASDSKYAGARVANNLAIIAEEMGDYLEARQLAGKAIEVFNEIGDRRNQSYASGNLANLLIYAGRYREAGELYRAADQVFLRFGENHPHYYTVGNLGDLELILGGLDAALAKYNEVERFAKESGDEELLAETTVRFAEHAYFSGQPKQAETLYLEAIRKAEAVGSTEFQIRSTIGLTRLLIGERRSDEAEERIQQLLKFVEATNSDRTRFEAEFLTGELMRIKGCGINGLEHHSRCAAYAAQQQQFELALKSNVRIYEIDLDSRESAAESLRRLLAEFETANGRDYVGRLMSSPYFQYFRATLTVAMSAGTVFQE